MTTVETDVLIVGSGPAGAAAALALSTDLGVEDEVVTKATPRHLRGNTVSTVDAAAHGRFTLFSGTGGEGWMRAADELPTVALRRIPGRG